MQECITVGELMEQLKRYPAEMKVLRYNMEMDGFENVYIPQSGDWSEPITKNKEGRPYVDWDRWQSDGDESFGIAFII